MSKMHPLKRAIAIAGSQEKLAAQIGVWPSNIRYWLHEAKDGTPAKHAIKIEEVTGSLVTRQDLRPDIFGKAET